VVPARTSQLEVATRPLGYLPPPTLDFPEVFLQVFPRVTGSFSLRQERTVPSELVRLTPSLEVEKHPISRKSVSRYPMGPF
jgi:hypothetical protein